MEEVIFANSSIVMAALLVCAVLAGIGVMFLVQEGALSSLTTLRRFSSIRYKRAAYRSVESLEFLIEEARRRVDTLNNYTVEYPIVFSQANWAKSVQTVEDLEAAYLELIEMLKASEFKRAYCFSEFLQHRPALGTEILTAELTESWDHLSDWQNDLNDTLQSISDSLGESAELTKKLGIERLRPRRPTLEALHGMRKRLGITEE